MTSNDSHSYNSNSYYSVPVVYAVERPDGRLQFYCVYCKKIHIHGSGYGHRIAHCRKDTQYSRTGYWLVPATTTTNEAVGAAITN